MDMIPGKIGVFDSGYGGLTILKDLRSRLPQYDYLYLGDNARAPYGNRSFDLIYRFTLEAVEELFARGCNLIILACNTASAKALRTIQMRDLPRIDPRKRVLGVIRPTAEISGKLTRNGHIGVLATRGTIDSGSYDIEIAKLYPDTTVTGQACPMWVYLIEQNEGLGPGADYFVRKYIDELKEKDPLIDTIILGCTHYPILAPKIRNYVDEQVRIVGQGDIVADSLADYLRRHPEMERACSHGASVSFLTTENPVRFSELASIFMGAHVEADGITLQPTHSL